MELFDYISDKKEPNKGDLLISEPFLTDPNFLRTVILVCEHNQEGSFGFVLNKKSNLKLNELVEGVGDREDNVYIGGPVQQNMLQFIHRSVGLIDGGVEIANDIYWGGNFEQMIAMVESGLVKEKDIKFFVGYSGWGPEQLKGELELKSWIISRSVSPSQIFDTDEKKLWKEVLNTMGGKYKIVSNFPVDPRLN